MRRLVRHGRLAAQTFRSLRRSRSCEFGGQQTGARGGMATDLAVPRRRVKPSLPFLLFAMMTLYACVCFSTRVPPRITDPRTSFLQQARAGNCRVSVRGVNSYEV